MDAMVGFRWINIGGCDTQCTASESQIIEKILVSHLCHVPFNSSTSIYSDELYAGHSLRWTPGVEQ